MSTSPPILQPAKAFETWAFHVVVVSGGAEPDPRVAQRFGVVDLVIAADSGLSHAASLGLTVTTAVGDFDSVTAEVLSQAEAQGVEIVPYPVSKDATDLELALELAVARGATHITMVSGGPGDRLDHFLGEISVLTASFLSKCQVVGWFGATRVSVIRNTVASTVFGAPGDLITLLPVTPETTGVTTAGLQYPLSNATLHAWRTRGVSNVLLEESAVVSLSDGVLLCVQPDALGSRS